MIGRRFRRNTFGDKIVITDEVRVYEGTKLKFKSKGHIVNQGLIAIVNLLSASLSSVAFYLLEGDFEGAGTDVHMRVGTGVGATTGATTDLTAPDPTPADTQGGTTSNPSGGSYRISWTATWNAGTIAALLVKELGLYLNIDAVLSTLQAFGWDCTGIIAATGLFSRLSSADGDFANFVIITAAPLTIEWRLTFSFA